MFIDYYIDFNTLAHCHYNFFFSKLNFIYMIKLVMSMIKQYEYVSWSQYTDPVKIQSNTLYIASYGNRSAATQFHDR